MRSYWSLVCTGWEIMSKASVFAVIVNLHINCMHFSSCSCTGTLYWSRPAHESSGPAHRNSGHAHGHLCPLSASTSGLLYTCVFVFFFHLQEIGTLSLADGPWHYFVGYPPMAYRIDYFFIRGTDLQECACLLLSAPSLPDQCCDFYLSFFIYSVVREQTSFTMSLWRSNEQSCMCCSSLGKWRVSHEPTDANACLTPTTEACVSLTVQMWCTFKIVLI